MSKDNYDFNAWMKEEDFRSVQKKLLEKKNVVAVGIGYKKVRGISIKLLTRAVVCSVSKKEPLADLKKKDVIPTKVKGIPTDVVEVGIIKALKARTDRWRPAPGGVSIGHEWITAGTLGCLVSKGGKVYILSNNHVLADSNNAPIGSNILQPGKYDDGLIDRIATLTEFAPLQWGGGEGCEIGKAVAGLENFFARIGGRQTRLKAVSIRQVLNRVDAAIALPVNIGVVKNEILELGKITGWTKGLLGMKVKKSGRTTGVTYGEITQVNVAVSVQYGNGKIAMFTDQLMIEPGGFSAGGDSGSVILAGGDAGSAVLDTEDNLVALLFAGSDQSTIVSPIEFVFEGLDVEVYLG